MRSFRILLVMIVMFLACWQQSVLSAYAQSQFTTVCLPVVSQISVNYDTGQNNYQGKATLGVVSNDPLCSILIAESAIVHIESESGLQIGDDQIYRLDGRDLIEFEIDGKLLTPEQKYYIKITPLDGFGEMFNDNEGEPAETTKEFTHLPPAPPKVITTIQAAVVKHDSKSLIVNVDISKEEEVVSFEGFVGDQETGANVFTVPPTLYTNRQIVIELPETNQLHTSSIEREYKLALCFDTRAETQVCAEPYTFKVIPPPPPTFMQRMAKALNNQPILLATILVIVMSTIGWIIVQNAQSKKKEFELRRPPMSGTDSFSASDKQGTDRDSRRESRASSSGTVRVKVVNTTSPADRRAQKVSNFPFRIGREGCDLNIPNDPHISKPHVEITSRGGMIYITDLGSRNGTTVNERAVQPNKPVHIKGKTTVRLGPNTELEVDLQV